MQMGCSAIVIDAVDRWLSGASESHDAGLAFMAELLAVELGLQIGWDLGLRQVICCTDCAVVRDVLQRDTNVDHYWARDVILRIRSVLS